MDSVPNKSFYKLPKLNKANLNDKIVSVSTSLDLLSRYL